MSSETASTPHARLRSLLPGSTMLVVLPSDQPHRRMAYQKAQRMAYGLWGEGSYTLRSTPDGVLVTRRKGEEK